MIAIAQFQVQEIYLFIIIYNISDFDTIYNKIYKICFIMRVLGLKSITAKGTRMHNAHRIVRKDYVSPKHKVGVSVQEAVVKKNTETPNVKEIVEEIVKIEIPQETPKKKRNYKKKVKVVEEPKEELINEEPINEEIFIEDLPMVPNTNENEITE